MFLNACHSQTQAKAISELGLITIGTSDEIVSAAAQDFASGFYRYLSQQPEVDILVALQKGKTRAARHEENLDELISVYSNGVKIF
ncbi:MAG: hypothetical protein HC892_23535 [Saprospiraceae bacterium]|nr:hypothetical protein [Saprospiraceae bacterium]